MKQYSRRLAVGKADLWKKKNRLLESLIFELTERCNNNCVHCYINKPKDDQGSQKKELTASEITQILKEAASLGCLGVRFTGGEPLLRDDFETIYLNARKLGMMVEIFTNGTLLTPRLVDLFVKFPPKKKILVTVYGISKAAYESVTRASGSHKAAFQGIERLLANNIPFNISTPILPQNMHEIHEMESWISNIFGPGHPSGVAMYLSQHARHKKNKSNLIKKNRIPPEEILIKLIKDKQVYIKGAQGYFSKNFPSPDSRLFICSAGAGIGSVDAYGLFQMCTMLRHPETVYDIKNGSLMDALYNFFPVVRKKRAKNPQYLMRCARCFLKSYCDHCPAQSCSANGSLDGIDEYFCEVAHAEARYVGLLEDREKAWEVKDWERRLLIFTNEAGITEQRKYEQKYNKEKQDGKKCKA